MVEKIAYELRQAQKLTSCITVKIRYSNFDTETIQRHIPYSSFDHELIPVALELFKLLYRRRMLVRLIGVRLSHLVPGVQQLNIFEDTPEMTSLYLAMDKIRNRFGRHAVKRAVSFS
jgi:DNA polymerase-4